MYMDYPPYLLSFSVHPLLLIWLINFRVDLVSLPNINSELLIFDVLLQTETQDLFFDLFDKYSAANAAHTMSKNYNTLISKSQFICFDFSNACKKIVRKSAPSLVTK